jgi:dihydropteroate synthase
MENMQVDLLKLQNKESVQAALADVGCDPAGTAIMREKALFYTLHVAHVQTKAANILKQTFLGKGGDAAVSRHTADLSEAYTDVLIFATLRQYRAAIKQMKVQPWGLQKIAENIEELLQKMK